MKETDMYHKLTNKLPTKGTLLQRIEMDRVPDIFYRTWMEDGWIELKVLNSYPKRSSIVKVPFRPGQLNWIKTYRILNGNVFLFFYIENSLWVFKGDTIREEYCETEMIELSCYKALWQDVDWDNIYKLLDGQPGIINLK